MAGVFRVNNIVLKRILQSSLIPARTISTSKKNSDTIAPTLNEQVGSNTKTGQKNWVSYGFDFNDEATDRRVTHSVMFFAITMCIIFGGFMWSYIPDYQLRDWAQREAYLELRRREKNDLPLVDPNLVPHQNVVIPGDSCLEGVEIII